MIYVYFVLILLIALALGFCTAYACIRKDESIYHQQGYRKGYKQGYDDGYKDCLMEGFDLDE